MACPKKAAATLMRIPKLRTPAPTFTGTAVVNGKFKELSLGKYAGKYVVLIFYPLDFTFVCPTELLGFSDRVKDFNGINCEVIAVSTDSEYCHLAWVNTSRKDGGIGEIDIPLLSDKSKRIARQYGMLNQDAGVALRGLFIIDDKQYIRQITINDVSVGRSVHETLRLVKAFQYTDKFGDMCPAGWGNLDDDPAKGKANDLSKQKSISIELPEGPFKHSSQETGQM